MRRILWMEQLMRLLVTAFMTQTQQYVTEGNQIEPTVYTHCCHCVINCVIKYDDNYTSTEILAFIHKIILKLKSIILIQ